MKEISPDTRTAERPRLSLEQKIMLLVRRYREAEKRRQRKEAARSKRLRMMTLSAFHRASWFRSCRTGVAVRGTCQHAGLGSQCGPGAHRTELVSRLPYLADARPGL